MKLNLFSNFTRRDGKILGISLIFSLGLIVISIFVTPQNINAQESTTPIDQNITNHTIPSNQSVQQDQIVSNTPHYPGDQEHHLKIYEKYGNTVIVHPGESYLSIAECNNNDILIGGGSHADHEFADGTTEQMPNGFQKDPKKWIVEGFVPQDGTTIEITSVAFCVIK